MLDRGGNEDLRVGPDESLPLLFGLKQGGFTSGEYILRAGGGGQPWVEVGWTNSKGVAVAVGVRSGVGQGSGLGEAPGADWNECLLLVREQ